MSSVAGMLRAAREKLDPAEARLLLGHVLGQSAAWLVAHDDEPLSEPQLALFASLCARRRGGEPIAYLTGYREFYGRDFAVAPGVLIPRPETELLVDIAKAEIQTRVDAGRNAASGQATVRTLDLGTGSGCIAISIALECQAMQPDVLALDASACTLDIARANAERLEASVRFIESHWFAELANERFDLIVSNPPYIAAQDPHLRQGDLVHEPASALASGADGLDAISTITDLAPRFLQPGGSLWLEHGYDQAEAVLNLLQQRGYTAIEQHLDIAGIVRVTGGIWAG